MLKLARSGWLLQAAGLGPTQLAAAKAGAQPAWGPLSTRLLGSAAGGASSSSSSSSSQQSSGQQESSQDDGEWTEVIDKATGQTYYWNQRTGETTSLGEERPLPGTSRYVDAQPAEGGATSVRFQEPVEKDQTFKYTVMGVLIGVFTGWASQFI